jgi:hypothetical protein
MKGSRPRGLAAVEEKFFGPVRLALRMTARVTLIGRFLQIARMPRPFSFASRLGFSTA